MRKKLSHHLSIKIDHRRLLSLLSNKKSCIWNVSLYFLANQRKTVKPPTFNKFRNIQHKWVSCCKLSFQIRRRVRRPSGESSYFDRAYSLHIYLSQQCHAVEGSPNEPQRIGPIYVWLDLRSRGGPWVQ